MNVLLRKPGVGEITLEMVAPRKRFEVDLNRPFLEQLHAAYEAGKEAGMRDVVEAFRARDGYADVMGTLEKERRRLGSIAGPMNRTIGELDAMVKAMDRFVEIAKGSTSKAHKRSEPIMALRGKLRPASFVPMKEEAGQPPLDKLRQSPWFDFRRLPIRSDDDMVAFGKELIENGLIELPFPECVFVLPFVDKSGRELSYINLLQQDDKKVTADAVLFIGVGSPIGGYGMSGVRPVDAVYYALAVLTSRSTVSTKRSIHTEAEVASTYRGDTYFSVSLRQHLATESMSGRSHASPRLHWRRGHIRHLGNRTTWVRATLVGTSDNGVVIHDYASPTQEPSER